MKHIVKIESTLIKAGIKEIAGVDEAGRGPCAGPLVVAAVILKDPFAPELAKVRDSKELSEKLREELFDVVIDQATSYSIIEISVGEIDTFGLHKSNLEGMRRAVNSLKTIPEYVLTDGYPIEGLAIPNLAVWKGDQVAISISAASILAKVYRDREMVKLDSEYPGYGLAKHKGYITAAHTKALGELGVSDIHRKSFANIAALINK
jgi:ribonuclease HII